MTPDHAKAVDLIRKMKRVNPTGKLVLALADELVGMRESVEVAFRAGWKTGAANPSGGSQYFEDIEWEKFKRSQP